MKKSTRNALIAAGILSAAAVTASYALCKFFVNVAVKRDVINLPDSVQNRLSGGLKSDPRVKEIEALGQKALKINMQEIKITSSDGIPLVAHYYPHDNPKRFLIAMHGWRSEWNIDFASSVDFYHNCGCSILFPDQRAQNNSGGDHIGFGVLERKDCLDWINYAVENLSGDLPIYLAGVSMGATTVLMASGLGLPDQVKGIIADCGFTSPADIFKHVLDNNLRVSGRVAYPLINALCKREAQFDSSEYSTLDALKNNDKPVLFIHGSDDGFVPLKMTVENYKACKAPKELLIVPGAGHGLSHLTEGEMYENSVLQFFEKVENNGF